MIRSLGISESIPSQIKDYDIFNYEILRNLADSDTLEFEVNSDEDRVDLIASKIYPTLSLDISIPIIVLLNTKSVFKKGEVIKYIPSERLSYL